MGGLIAAIIGLPMGLAFGVQSGLGPQAGIYTAIILGITAAVFGGTRTLISDPTGPMTVVAATVVSLSIAEVGTLEAAWPLIVGTFVLAGLFELVFGIFDFGKYVKYMPYPVVSGFMAGIGVIIIAVQLFPIMGLDSPKGFVNILLALPTQAAGANWTALALGGLTIAIIYLFPLVTRRVSSILVALIVSTLVAVLLGLDVPVIGEIPSQLPHAHFDDLLKLSYDDVRAMIVPAMLLAGLGVIDSLLTSVVADNITKTKHNSRWTIIGQGVGNLLAGLFGGIPGAGATMGTVTNIRAGARSEVSGVVKGLILLVILLSLAEYVQYIPVAVLAGILITIGIGIIDYRGIRMLLKVPRQDAAVWAIVLGVTLFDNLLNAVAVGFVLSAVLFIGRMSQNMVENQRIVSLPEVIGRHALPKELADRIIIKRLEGPLFFGFAHKFRAHCERIKEGLVVILDLEAVPFLDQSGMITLEIVIQDWHNRGIQVYILGANPQVLHSLMEMEVVPQLVNHEHCFKNVDRCLETIRQKLQAAAEPDNYEAALLDDHILENRAKSNPNA